MSVFLIQDERKYSKLFQNKLKSLRSYLIRTQGFLINSMFGMNMYLHGFSVSSFVNLFLHFSLRISQQYYKTKFVSLVKRLTVQKDLRNIQNLMALVS